MNEPSARNILGIANEIIYGDREQTYGDPSKNLQIIADYWATYLSSNGYPEKALTAEDVCNMMVLLKVARLGNTPGHHDSLVDICGYTALSERVIRANQQKEKGAATPAA